MKTCGSEAAHKFCHFSKCVKTSGSESARFTESVSRKNKNKSYDGRAAGSTTTHYLLGFRSQQSGPKTRRDNMLFSSPCLRISSFLSFLPWKLVDAWNDLNPSFLYCFPPLSVCFEPPGGIFFTLFFLFFIFLFKHVNLQSLYFAPLSFFKNLLLLFYFETKILLVEL